MRKLLIVSLVAGALAFGLLVPRGTSAPIPEDKPVQWEYAEFRVYPAGASWRTGHEEVSEKTTGELADRLKAPPAKEGSDSVVHRLRVLNKLSADGWEVIEHSPLNRPFPDPMFGTHAWFLKRRLP